VLGCEFLAARRINVSTEGSRLATYKERGAQCPALFYALFSMAYFFRSRHESSLAAKPILSP